MAETAAQIAQHYTAMGHSVTLINNVINDEQEVFETEEEKSDAVDRNVRHLEIMLTRDYWTNEDMTEVDAAIVAGNAYNA
jgi:hypothetical protein